MKIQAIYESNAKNIFGFPNLKLIAKCLVDDGSYEANIYLSDNQVVNILKFTKDLLEVKSFYLKNIISISIN
jgi:hypothetical protein